MIAFAVRKDDSSSDVRAVLLILDGIPTAFLATPATRFRLAAL
jgi:hypothetical protein